MAVANASGAKVGNTFRYDPYGNALTGLPDKSESDYDYGWLGRHQRGLEHRGTIATIEMGARQYVPSLGRFLEVDPIAGGSANDYEHCNGDPINCTDLSGTYAGNESEKKWCRWPSRWRLCNRAKHLADVAFDMTRARYGGIGGNGEADAYQHIVWAMLMTIEFGPGTARGFLDRHERTPGQPAEERSMDEHNNALGVYFGEILVDQGHTSRGWVDAAARLIIFLGVHSQINDGYF